MASQSKYDIYRSIYEEEIDRAKELINRSKIVLGLCTFFAGGIAFKYEDLFGGAGEWATFVGFLSIALVATSLLGATLTLTQYTPNRIFFRDDADLPRRDESDDEFRLNRILELMRATRRIARQNLRREAQMAVSTWSLMIGGYCLISVLAVGVRNASFENDDGNRLPAMVAPAPSAGVGDNAAGSTSDDSPPEGF